MGKKLSVRDAVGKGRGVFAVQAIQAGSFITKFRGRLYHAADIPPGCLSMQVGHDEWLCSDGTGIDDLINHSCDPNVGFLAGASALHAIRDIAAGEEICWDYSTSIDEPGWCLRCACGSRNCRRVVLPFSGLSPADQDRLRSIALRYLRS